MRPTDIAFRLGPRLNAAGRIGSAQLALDLLLCGDADRAAELANTLDVENQKRQKIEHTDFAITLEVLDGKGTKIFKQETTTDAYGVASLEARLASQVNTGDYTVVAAIDELTVEKTVEVSVGGGKVTVVATCAGDVESIKISPEVVDPEDVEILEDLVLSGVKQAIEKGKETASEEMGKLTEGLPLPPGMGL